MEITKYWKTIADTLQDGLLVVDPGGVIQAANQAAEKMTGYTQDELIGKSCRILNCTGCKIIGKGPGEQWCGLFSRGSVMEKKCLITNKDRRSVRLLLVRYRDAQNARAAIAHFEKIYLPEKHLASAESAPGSRQFWKIEDGWLGYVGRGRYVALVLECPSQESAIRFLEDTLNKVDKFEATHE